MTLIEGLYEVSAILKAVDKSGILAVRADLFSAMDGAIDVFEKADSLRASVELAQKDVDYCVNEEAGNE